MHINNILQERSNGQCELCSSTDGLRAYAVPPRDDSHSDHQVVLCGECFRQIAAGDFTDESHWRCLTGSIWSEVPAVQALSYKLLQKMRSADWAQETLESVFPEESVISWAEAEDAMEAAKVVHKDAFGVVLESGDTVILTQNLNVKGANFIAPKGTIVRKIRLVADNAGQIEGKINGDTIVIKTEFVRRQA
jgi:protein PhnA